MDSSRLKRVLIIKPSSLGDVIHALPVADALKAGIPGVEIDWVAGVGFDGILEGNPSVSRIITFDRRMLEKPGGLKRLSGFVRELRRNRYDLVLDLQGLLRSGLMAFACRADSRVGFANAREGAALFYTGKVAVPDPEMHAVDRYLLCLEFLNLKAPDDVCFTVKISEDDNKKADALLRELGVEEGEPFVAVAASARWETKRWPAENFAALANRLIEEHGVKSVFVGTREEGSVMAGQARSLRQKGSFAFGRTSLKSLSALIKKASVLVTNDSGPMHIAAAVGTPAVAVFGPTDPKRTGPYGKIHKVVTAGVECAPCFRKKCGDVKCMTGVTVEMVYDKVADVMRKLH